MGCDIHAYVEHRKNYGWCCFAKLYLDRDYRLFGALADVRNYDEVECLITPKGYPKDGAKFGCSVEDYYCFVSSEPEPKDEYCTREDAEHWIKYYGSKYKPGTKKMWVSIPDWHTPSWLTLKELRAIRSIHEDKQLDSIIALMETLEKPRLVFWFDN